MNPIKMFRKLVKIVRGGYGGRPILLGFMLGVIIGMVPGINLTVLLAVAAFMILNAHFALMMIGLGIGKVLCLLLAPVTYEIGRVIIHSVGLEGLFRTAASTPVIALLDLQVYSLVGGLPIALLVGGVGGLVLVKIVKGLRVGILEAKTRSPKFQKLSENKAVAIFMRLVFGKVKLGDGQPHKEPVLRKSGVILTAIVIVVGLALELLLLDAAVRAGVERGLGAAVGAEVNVGRARLSLAGAGLTLENLQITDPEQPTHNMLQIDRLQSDISVRDLLTKRFVIDNMEIAAARTDVRRSTPGKVYERPAKDEPEVEEAEDAFGRYIEIAQDLRKYEGYIERLREYLKEREVARQREEEALTPEQIEAARRQQAELARQQGYLRMSASELLTKHPALTIRRLSIDSMTIGDGEARYAVKAREISSAPELNPEPMAFNVTERDGTRGELSFNFAAKGGEHHIEAFLPNFSVGETVSLSDNVPLDMTSGKATAALKGSFTASTIDLPVTITVNDMQAQGREGRSVLGLDPKTAQEIFSSLSELTVIAQIVGPIDSPSLKIDEGRLMADLQDALVKAGKAQLANRVNQEAEKARSKVEEAVQGAVTEQIDRVVPDVEKIAPVVPQLPGLRDVLPGQTKEAEGEEKPEEKPVDRIRGILGR